MSILSNYPNMVRDYRLTLDTPEDYEMFKQLFENLSGKAEH